MAAFVAVLAVAAGGAWTLGALDGGGRQPTQEAGLLAESRDRTPAATDATDARTTPARADRASRGRRVPAVPPLGPVASAATTTAPAPAATARTTAPPPPPTTRTRTAPAPRPSTSSAPAPSTAEAEVTRLTNIERAKAGCGALRVDARLAAAAEAHSRDMVDRDYFSHTSPDGMGPGERAAAAGYPQWSGENIAAGYPTPEAVVRGWMNSPGHKANILNCQSKATGVGYDERENMWTQMFGFE